MFESFRKHRKTMLGLGAAAALGVAVERFLSDTEPKPLDPHAVETASSSSEETEGVRVTRVESVSEPARREAVPLEEQQVDRQALALERIQELQRECKRSLGDDFSVKIVDADTQQPRIFIVNTNDDRSYGYIDVDPDYLAAPKFRWAPPVSLEVEQGKVNKQFPFVQIDGTLSEQSLRNMIDYVDAQLSTVADEGM
ncbi:MAG: hypothetical protein KIH62_002800 [Candidatus Kerfeldbacteria bacterium]|nr:hypothetical protein [Candidatus Kerfeldbacteria bacterium]